MSTKEPKFANTISDMDGHADSLVKALEQTIASPKPSIMSALISTHMNTWASVCNFDAESTSQHVQKAICDAEDAALTALLNHRCTDISEVQQRMAYICGLPDLAERVFGGEIDNPRSFLSMLVGSMLPQDHTPKTDQVAA